MSAASYLGAILIGAVAGGTIIAGCMWGYAERRARTNDERERALDMAVGEFELEKARRVRELDKRERELNTAGAGAAARGALARAHLAATRPTSNAPVHVLTAAGRHQATSITPHHHLASARMATGAYATVGAAA